MKKVIEINNGDNKQDVAEKVTKYLEENGFITVDGEFSWICKDGYLILELGES